MSKRLQSLEDFNKGRMTERLQMTAPRKNGIACPKCGAEMIDTNPDLSLLSNPPQKKIHCSDCGHRACRVA